MNDAYVEREGRNGDASLLIMAVLLIMLMFLGLVAYSSGRFMVNTTSTPSMTGVAPSNGRPTTPGATSSRGANGVVNGNVQFKY